MKVYKAHISIAVSVRNVTRCSRTRRFRPVRNSEQDCFSFWICGHHFLTASKWPVHWFIMKRISRQSLTLKPSFQVVVPHFLPHLVIKASPQATALSRCLAKNLQISKRELFTKNFKNIFCHLVCNCSGIEMKKALTYVEVNN